MKIIIFAAHPDDAEISVGGSICRYLEAGHQVHVIHTTGKKSKRFVTAGKTAAILGHTYEFMDLKDRGLGKDQLKLGLKFDEPTLKAVYKKIKEHKPDMVWSLWPIDCHPDHAGLGTCVTYACDLIRLEKHKNWCPELWYYYGASGYQSICMAPNHYEDITPYVERKRLAIEEYAKVVDVRAGISIHETSWKYNGYQSGFLYAEAFTKCSFRIGDARYEVVGEGIELTSKKKGNKK